MAAQPVHGLQLLVTVLRMQGNKTPKANHQVCTLTRKRQSMSVTCDAQTANLSIQASPTSTHLEDQMTQTTWTQHSVATVPYQQQGSFLCLHQTTAALQHTLLPDTM
jgi:hypothetical protein